jgi:RNA polymerase-binding transcription factor DksA
MTPRLVQELALALERERQRLLNDLRDFGAAERDLGPGQADAAGGVGDLADGAPDPAEAEVLRAVEHAERRRLQEVEAALHRIGEGRYGVCEGCGQPIWPPRLQAVPWTRYCRRCVERYAAGQAAGAWGWSRSPTPAPGPVR